MSKSVGVKLVVKSRRYLKRKLHSWAISNAKNGLRDPWGTNYENLGGWVWCFCWGGAVEFCFEVLRILLVGLVCFLKTKVTWLAKWVWGLGSTGEYRAVDVSTVLTTKNHVLQREREKKLGSCDGRTSRKKEQLRLIVHHIPSLTKVTKKILGFFPQGFAKLSISGDTNLPTSAPFSVVSPLFYKGIWKKTRGNNKSQAQAKLGKGKTLWRA